MGVQSLTTYVRKKNLGVYETHPNPQDTSPIPLIVDGLAFAYHIGLVDTFEGGGYSKIKANVRKYVEYWRICGLEPAFVWDGPFDASKLPTVIHRSTQSLQRSLKWMNLPDYLRADYANAQKATRLPPLTHMSISAELEALGVPSHCAEEEADSPTAELANRKNGFVLSNDSDYFIYPTQCRGYVPLNTVEYGPFNEPRLEKVPPNTPARVRFRVFQPATIARSFSVPPAFLPILAALIGNDIHNYAPSFSQNRKFANYTGYVDPRELQRIAGILSMCSGMPVETLAQIQDVVLAVLPRLLQRPVHDPNIIANISMSAYSYALRPLEAPSPTYPLHPRTTDTPDQAKARAVYDTAYKSSRLSSFVLHVLKHGVVMLQGMVEMPEHQSPMISLARPIRSWIYAIVREMVGIERPTVVEYARVGFELYPSEVTVPSLLDLAAASEWNALPDLLRRRPLIEQDKLIRKTIAYAALRHSKGYLTGFDRYGMVDRYTLLIVSINWILRMHRRPFTEHEVNCAVLVAALIRHEPSRLATLASLAPQPPLKPSIQRSVELVSTLVTVNILFQVLLLHPDGVDDSPCAPHELFDGKAFHAVLAMSGSEFDETLKASDETAQLAFAKVVAACLLGRHRGA
ncbi:asteroid-like protein [Rhodotorula toruloides]|uniref:Asteroid-like protein n=1 Tax=Rhodotorula toruloides TaxID=5286 RepID=A0A511KJ66_RHOTO|nr:asteroid-like protein [Rhodotorula toruloides]